jgi:hypothetical protein
MLANGFIKSLLIQKHKTFLKHLKIANIAFILAIKA